MIVVLQKTPWNPGLQSIFHEWYIYVYIYRTNCLIRSKTAIMWNKIIIELNDSRKIVIKRISEGIFGNYQMNFLTEFDL